MSEMLSHAAAESVVWRQDKALALLFAVPLKLSLIILDFISAMPNFAPTIARQALRIASRRYPSPASARCSPRVAAAQAHGRRSYVSETKADKASVNVETAIKADQKAFLNQTGDRAQDATMPTTGMGADAMMSPTAGALLYFLRLPPTPPHASLPRQC